MTAWTTIPSGDRDPESPVTPELVDGLYFNPFAIVEKAVGAPVLADDYIVAAMIKDAEVGPSKLPASATGTVLISQSAAIHTDTHATMTKVKEIYCPTPGTLTVLFDLAATNGGSTVTGRIYVNGSAVGTERTTNIVQPSYNTYSESVAVNAGDLVQIYTKGQGTNYVFTKNLQIKVSAAIQFAVTLEL